MLAVRRRTAVAAGVVAQRHHTRPEWPTVAASVFRGQGNAGLDGGASGHIYITVRVAQHPKLRQAVSFVLRHLFR